MKQQITVIIKLLGLIFLIAGVFFIISLVPVLIQDIQASYDYKYISLFYSVLPITGLFIFFYWCMYRTENIIRYFRLCDLHDTGEQSDTPFSISIRTAFKTGIFLIGFYLLAVNLPNVIIQLVQWLITELGTVQNNSLDDLLNIFSPFVGDSLLYSLIYSIAGYVLAFENSRIADYFLSKDVKK